MSKFSDKINKYFSQDEYRKARELILKRLKKDPYNHWLLARLSTTYYEEKKYKQALKITKKAFKIAPRCPLVLWDYACDLDINGKYKMAITIWKKLLGKGASKIAHEECGEGIRWAKSLLSDCKYRIGISYFKMGDFAKAAKYLQMHIANRKPGIPSIYPLSIVKKKLREIEKERRKKRTG